MAVREDQGKSMKRLPPFQSMPAQGFAYQGFTPIIPSPAGFVSAPSGYPIPIAQPQMSIPFSTNSGRSSDPRNLSGRQFQPQESLPGPWVAKEPKVSVDRGTPKMPQAATSARLPQSPETKSFWSITDTVLKREEAAQHLCHVKEELLEQRITFVENIIFRAMDLPAHDVKYAAELVGEEKEIHEQKKRELQDKHDHDFQRHYIGPYPSIVTFPENGFFVDTLRAVKDWPHREEKAREHERFRKTHPIVCALAGDFHYFSDELQHVDLI